jgi:hypothetical protein
MTEFPGLVLPAYYEHYAAPVKLIETSDGGVVAWRASSQTGAWEERNDLIDEIIFARGGETFVRSVEDFIDTTEEWRADWNVANGTIAALYGTASGIVDVARAENRRLTDTEAAMVRAIRRRTYRMFEERLRAEGNPAADPDLLEREGSAST